MSKKKLKNFNLIDEVSRDYYLLFPGVEEGRVVMTLYERMQSGRYDNDRFDEDEVHRIFDFYRLDGEKKERHLSSVNKRKFEKLLKFFFKYDDSLQLYSFQEYGINFCEIAKTTLEGSFSPTKIEKICAKLRNELDEVLDDDDKLLDWFDLNLDIFKTRLRQQTDFLYRQVDDAVNTLREDVLARDQTPVNLLKTVRDDLVKIQKRNNKLRKAFYDTHRINTVLSNINSENEKINDFVEEALLFFDSVHSRLTGIDHRVDRIKPKIKQLFATLNQPQFNAKMQRFILFILEHSTLIDDGQNKEVCFPEPIKSTYYGFEKSRYPVIAKDKSIFPTKPRPRVKYKVNKEVQDINEKELKQDIDSLQKIRQWVKQLIAQLERENKLDVSESFFEVFESESNLQIALEVSFKLIEKAYDNNRYDVYINPNEKVKSKNTSNVIWRTSIVKM